MPAQSPTLSPTLSAMTAGLRGSSSGMPASTLPTRSAPTSAPLVKMPPPKRANIEISEPPKAKADERTQRAFRITQEPQHGEVVAGDAEKAQANYQHAGNGAAAERDLERRVDARMSGLRRAHVGAHRDEHADVACESGENGADGEAARGGPAQRETQGDEQDDSDNGDGGILPIQIRLGARLNRRGDFLHARIARGLSQNPAHRNDAVEDRNNTCCNRQP